MGKEERARKAQEKRAHNEAIRAWKVQNGYVTEPNNGPPDVEVPPVDKPTEKPYEFPDWALTDSEREMIAFAAHLAATRGVWQEEARLRRLAEDEESARWLAERNEQFAIHDREREGPSRPLGPVSKGSSSMSSHNDSTVSALLAAKDSIEQARGALTAIEQAVGGAQAAVAHADQKVSEAAGYTAQAMGTTTHISGRLVSFGTGRDDIGAALRNAVEQARMSMQELSLIVSLYDEAIAHFQAQGQ